MPFVAREEARLYEAACADGTPQRYMRDLQEALENNELTPLDFSIQDLFVNFVEDGSEIVMSWNPRHGGGGVQLMEAGVDTGAFANITGQIVYTTVMDAFNDPTFIAPQLTTTVPTSFNGEKIPGISRIGDEAEMIGEGEEYPLAGVSEEWIETPQTTKRGFIVPVTKEAVFFDRTGLVLQRAGETSTMLAINKEKRILDMCLGITDLYIRNGVGPTASYGDNSGNHDWDNLAASNPFTDWRNVEAAELLFDAITDPNTGEPIVLQANTIVAPTALIRTVQYYLSSTEVREVTNTDTTTIGRQPLNYTPVSNQYVKNRTGSATTWFIGDFRNAFWYMENWPIQSIQAPANSELEFTRDIIARYKVTERGTGAVREPRRVVKCTA